MKVALLTDGIMPFVVGGMQKHSHYLAAFLARQGVEVVLLHCVHTANIPEREEVLKALDLPNDASIEIIGRRFPRMGNMPGHYLRESYADSIEVFKFLKPRLNEFDVIYSKGFTAWELLNRKRKGLQTPPVAVKFHGYEMFQYTPGIQGIFSRWLLRGPVTFCNKNADFVYSYGGKITDLITQLGVPRNHVIEVPTGIAASWCRSEPLPTTAGAVRRFVFVGRYERRKGIEELHSMLGSMPEEIAFEFHFIGPIPPSKKIKNSRIVYHGQLKATEDIQAILDASHVLVTPSYAEGMPNVIMEGMARGLAVIATDVGAVSAQVDAQNGWLIEAANEEALRVAFEQALYLSAASLDAMRMASAEKVRRTFTWEQVIQQTLRSFEQLGK
jgi:glycosyltransferase involved in cell wall biosynthesis